MQIDVPRGRRHQPSAGPHARLHSFAEEAMPVDLGSRVDVDGFSIARKI